jgi:23S rRNA (cytosine1962-C5)-methyltransferase
MSGVVTEYELLDSGDFQKLERIGPFKIVRPSPQAVWPPANHAEWQHADAVYTRFSGGDGKWTINNKKINQPFTIQMQPMKFVIKLTDFGHLGIFPEQTKNWQTLHKLIKDSTREKFQVLNLFAYTGGATLACASAGASVAHVDASKTSVAWANENAAASQLKDAPVRWLVDDVKKFVAREVRRKSEYHGVILDPPSYGRGNNNEVWKIESDLPILLEQISSIMAKDWSFILLSAHSPGYTPQALKNILLQTFKDFKGTITAEEMLIESTKTPIVLPSGASCLFHRS